MKIKAFTLAEVLMVIGIIGTVAVVTLPNLSQNTSDMEYITRVKKADSILQTAFDLAKEKYGENLNTWISGDSNLTAQSTRFGSRISKYLSISKKCGTSSGCFGSTSMKSISGSYTISSLDNNSSVYKVMLSDDVSVAFSGMTIYVDVDGPKKGLNKLGYDIFVFNVDATGNLLHLDKSGLTNDVVNTCRTGTASVCTDWIIQFGNMDYLKCTDLSGASKQSCK